MDAPLALPAPIRPDYLGPRDVYPTIELFVEKPTDLTALADQLTKLVPLGLRVDAKEIRDKWGLVEPEEGAEILTAPQMPSPYPEFSGMGDADPKEPVANADAPVEPGMEAVQDSALNGAQTASLLQITDYVTSGRIPKSSAKALIKGSFPTMSDERINAIVDPLEVIQRADADVGGGFESEHSARNVKPQKKEYAEVVSDQLEAAAADAMDGLLEPVRRLVASANSYQEIMDGMESMFPGMDDEGYMEMLAGALVAAKLAGAYSVRTGRND